VRAHAQRALMITVERRGVDRAAGRAVPRVRAAPIVCCLALAAPGCARMGFDAEPGAESILQAFRAPRPSEAVVWAIDPYDPSNRYRGTLLLAGAPFADEPPYLALFVDNASDPDSSVREAAIRGLANHGGPEHVPLVAERLLDDPEPRVRVEAARALQRIHSPAAVDALLAAIELSPRAEPRQPDPAVRAEAARALGQYPQNRVVDRLILSLVDPSLLVNTATLHSLRTLTGQDFGFDRPAWVAWHRRAGQGAFAAGSVYLYPAFRRERRWMEYIPFFPQPPNEVPGTPAGWTGRAGGA
jgi:hypothetical protein